MTLKAGALIEDNKPIKISKESARRINQADRTKLLQSFTAAEFVWAKIRQYKLELALALSVAINVMFIYNFIVYGVK